MAMKRAPDRLPLLKAVYDEDFRNAFLEDREKVALNFVPFASYLRVT